jgi:hypothetical protein
VNTGALWSKFIRELALVSLPWIAFFGAGFAGLASGVPIYALAAIPAAILAWIVLIPICYPFSQPQDTNVLALMADPAASPVIGYPVHIQGEVIGRADAGSIVGEDTIFADRSGRIAVDFRSLLGPIGDLWTGWRRVKHHIGEKGEVTGWFRRSMGGYVILNELKTPAGRLKAYPYLSGVVVPLIVFAILGVIALFASSL